MYYYFNLYNPDTGLNWPKQFGPREFQFRQVTLYLFLQGMTAYFINVRL